MEKKAFRYKIKHTARISSAPENNGPVLVLLRSEDLVELQRKAVEMSNVKRAKVVVEGVVEKSIIYCEIVGLLVVLGGSGLDIALRSLPRRPRSLVGVGKQRVGIGRLGVSGEI